MPAERFVTIADHAFLVNVLALLESLRRHRPDAELWLLAVDQACADTAARLDLPGLRVLPVAAIETPELIQARTTRSRAEYCWTLTPFSLLAVLQREPATERVTYLDADMLLLANPLIAIEEMRAAGASIMLTPHAFAPEYAWLAATSGTFCVQFMTVARTPAAVAAITTWAEQCVAWCFARNEPGRCGDQFYLEDWPRRHAGLVHVLAQPQRLLGPWNVRHVLANRVFTIDQILAYHFHGCRMLDGGRVQLHAGYRIGSTALPLYDHYLAALARAAALLQRAGAAPPAQRPVRISRLSRLRNACWSLVGRYRERRLPEPSAP